MTSSLRRAVQQEQFSNKDGRFESCFAGGLDLSEFVSPNRTGASLNGTSTSASAELLKVKAEESRLRHEQQAADAHMEQVAKERGQQLQADLLTNSKHAGAAAARSLLSSTAPGGNRKKRSTNTSKLMTSVLVSMHEGDERGAAVSHHKNNRTKNKALRKQKQQQQAARNPRKSMAAKRKTRSKY